MIIFLSSGWLRKPTRKSPNHDMTSFGITTLCVCDCENQHPLPAIVVRCEWLIEGFTEFSYEFGWVLKRFALSCLKRESLSFTSTIWGSWQSVTIWFGYLDVIAVYLLLIYWVIFVTYVKWWSNLKTSFHIEYIQKNWYLEESCLFWGETNVTRLRLNLCSSHFAPDFPPIFPT